MAKTLRKRKEDADETRSWLSDPTNQQIVEMLEQDGRRPYSEIAKSLGVAEGTVRNRVSQLMKSKQLSIIAISAARTSTYRADAMIAIKVEKGFNPEDVAERLAGCYEIVYILLVASYYDLILEVVADTHDDFVNFLMTNCYGQTDIGDLEIMTGLSAYKHEFMLTRGLF